jgi:hypothetical protein
MNGTDDRRLLGPLQYLVGIVTGLAMAAVVIGLDTSWTFTI